MEQAMIVSSGPTSATTINARGAERIALFVRAAKLVADGHDYLCVLRDISATGAKLRLFHPLPSASLLQLDAGSGERLTIQMMWHNGDDAGFRFEHPIDVQSIVEGNCAGLRRRQIRLDLERPVAVRTGDKRIAASLHNISQSGAGIECDHHLLIRQPVQIEIHNLPVIRARVCWRHFPRYGLVFENCFALADLARHLVRLHREVSAIATRA